MKLASDVKVGYIIKLNNEMWKVCEVNHVKPGKGGAFAQMTLKNIKNNKKLDHRFRVEDKVEKIDIMPSPGVFIYNQGDDSVFLNLETTEEVNITNYEKKYFLTEGLQLELLFIDDVFFDVKLPDSVECVVEDAPSYIKGQSVAAQDKVVTLTNGLKIKAPQFIEAGDKIIVNTETLNFVSRSK
jgi:elongation factor P